MISRRVLVLGATSGIARATARLWAREGHALFLVARDAGRLDVVARDLLLRGATRVDGLVADLDDCERHEAIVAEADRELGGLDVVFMAHGVLGDPARCRESFGEAAAVLRTNLLGPVSLLTVVANRFEAQGAGTIVVLSSVAGDRGRGHYVYGASKGALSLFLQGLRQRLWPRGVRVLTVKPGFVATPMTAHMEQTLLFASPETVARGILRALRRGRDVVYLPWFWRWIMLVIRLIPERVFKRLKL